MNINKPSSEPHLKWTLPTRRKQSVPKLHELNVSNFFFKFLQIIYFVIQSISFYDTVGISANRKTSRAIATTKKAKATKATKTTKATKSTKATKTTKAKAKSTSTPNEPTNVAPTLPPSNPLPITRPDANQILNKNRERVLDTLNNGTEKDIGKLPTIGPKKASTIFNHR